MANISKVYLLNTPLEDDMKNTLYFASASAQQSYMQNNILKSYVNVSYQRDTSTFRCPAHIDTIRNCNYMMYQNTAYSNKWFYCFIKKMTYISDGLTDVEFEVDPLQTFMFDVNIKPSFVEREHTNDDTVGSNTVPENIELGDYVETALAPQKEFSMDRSETMYCIAFTRLVDDWVSSSSQYDGGLTPINLGHIPDGFIYLGYDSLTYVKNTITIYNDRGHADYISAIFVVPKGVFQNPKSWTSYTGQQVDFLPMKVYQTYTPFFEDSCAITTNQQLADSYSPRNNKLLTFPYRYLQMSNMNGSVANYHYEYFVNPLDGTIDTTPEFDLKGVSSIGGDMKVYPKNYKGIQNNIDEGLGMGKLPVGGWSNDIFTNWMTQNGVNIAIGFASDVASIATGVATSPAGGGVGIIKGISGIADTIGQIYQHSMQPPQAEGATNIGSATYDWGMTAMTFKHMSIRKQFAQIADDFFDMFGYATHRVKTPNKAHRQNWWYTKTIDCNITGNVPNDYMNQIKDAYNNGITFWRNPSNFLNYSVSNGIV